VPTIAVFYGIVIRLYFADHPPPHIHAIYGGDEALVAIDPRRSSPAACLDARPPWCWNGLRYGGVSFWPPGMRHSRASALARCRRWSSDGMLHRISELRVEPGYRLWVRFADGVEGEVDVSALVGSGMFTPLADESFFATAFIDEFGALGWPNGADLAPDAMHDSLKHHGRWQPRLAASPQPV
jgi:hypothetical protein